MPDWAPECSAPELERRGAGTPVPGRRPGRGTECIAGDVGRAGTGSGGAQGSRGLGELDKRKLTNRYNMIAQTKARAVSICSGKGIVSVVAIRYGNVCGLAFWKINTLNQKLDGDDQVVTDHELKILEKNKVAKELGKLTKSLKLSRSIVSNKSISFRVLAQVASSVPKRVRYNSIEYNGSE